MSLIIRDPRNPQKLDLDPFIKHLCGMERRILVYCMYGDIELRKGYFLTKKNIFIPYEIPSIEHEIAHMVEFRNFKRLTLADWGMSAHNETPKANALFAALSREVRVRAIQLHMQPKSIGDNKDTCYNIFANSHWRNMANELLPYGRFKTLQDVESWVGDLRERTYKSWSLDRITDEWKTRLDYIRDYMETNLVG